MNALRRSIVSLFLVFLIFNVSVAIAEIKINGFASFVGGLTTSEAEVRSLFNGSKSDSTFISDRPTNGEYNDKLNFRPDSIYGLQFLTDLDDGLSVTGQITGSGGEDFDANIAWAYVTYEFNESLSLLMGRQRTPLFFYSDFLDIGYSYHWIRPPVETVGSTHDFEGVRFLYSTSTDDWNSQFQIYKGASFAISPSLGAFGANDSLGFVAYTSNDWFQIRGTYVTTKIYFENSALTTDGKVLDKDNPVKTEFFGAAIHATFDNLFVVTEYVYTDFDVPLAADVSLGEKSRTGYYISSGYLIGNFTPHITYSVQISESSKQSLFLNNSQDVKTQAWTIGLRWDFHNNAVFKVEYLSRSDESDDFIKNEAGVGQAITGAYTGGRGDYGEIDVFNFGVDLIF